MTNFSATILCENFQYYFPTNIQNAFRAFETSWETDNLESEDKRNVYCELIDWRRDLNWNANKSIVLSNKITTDNRTVDDYGENKNKTAINDNQAKWWTEIALKGENFIETLSSMALRQLIRDYNSGSIDERIFGNNRVMFGRLLDLNYPIFELLELENEEFWKRIVESKLSDKIKLQNLLNDLDTNWKKIGIELMYTEYIENLEISDIFSPKIKLLIDSLTEKCSGYIENLTIRKVNSKKEKLKNEFNKFIVTRNYKDDEVSHISLEFLKGLKNIKNFSITFDSQVSAELYERRFYQVSIHDIENFSKSLETFIHLETLEITQTNLRQHEKIFYLLSSIENVLGLRVLTLTHCNISSKESGALFESFLSKNSSLKEINLKDNELDSGFCYHFSLGIENFKGTFRKLTLSINPILHDGLEFIIRGISKIDNVINLDISSCDGFNSDHYGTAIEELVNLVSTSKNLNHLNISNDIITSKINRKNFLTALESNYSLFSISNINCGFSTKEELDIHILILRNNYYKQNEILKKETFTRQDEINIEKWLRRTKHPLLMNARTFVPTENMIKWKNQANKILCKHAGKDYENFTFYYAGN